MTWWHFGAGVLLGFIGGYWADWIITVRAERGKDKDGDEGKDQGPRD